MRTTLNIDDDILAQAKALARVHQVSVGEALSDLARRGTEVQARIVISPVTGLPVLNLPGNLKITTESVQRLLDEMDLPE
jgi:hypothetical protein